MWLLQAELLPGQVSPWDVNWRSCDFESVSPFWLVAPWLGDYVTRCGAQCLLCGGLVLFKLHIFYWVTWVAVSLKLHVGLRQPRLFCRGTEVVMTVTTAAAIVTVACPASCGSARSCSSHSRYFRKKSKKSLWDDDQVETSFACCESEWKKWSFKLLTGFLPCPIYIYSWDLFFLCVRT